MDTFSAFARATANSGKEHKVFDWDKAAKLIVEKKAQVASAGLSGDWEYTGGCIFKNDQPVPQEDTYTYLSSNLATPELEIDGQIISCYRMQSKVPDWDSRTYWPASALAILNAAK